MIPPEKIAEVKQRASILEVAARYASVVSAGRTSKCCCPFHKERTPSMYLYPQDNSYHCFGCGAHGDVIKFVSELEGTSFLETVERLAEQFGVSLPRSGNDAKRAEQRAEKDVMLRITSAAAEVWRTILLRPGPGEVARAYMRERKIDDVLAERFRIGYAPTPDEGGWDTLARELSRRGLSLEVAAKLGLVARSERTGAWTDKFFGRLMFPIIKPGDAVLGFSGRILPCHAVGKDGGDAPPKYLNSSESALYQKRESLFGLHLATQAMRKRNRAILVEGNVDVVSMHRRGFEEAVAPLGTALTAEQCALLAKFAQSVVLCFDGDQAGRKAAREALPLLLDAGLEPRVVPLPDGQDPDDADDEQLALALDRPRPALEWFVQRMVAAGAKESPEAKGRATRAIGDLIRRVKGKDVRGDYAVYAANLLEVPVRRLWWAVDPESAPRADRERSGSRPAVRDSAPPSPERSFDPRSTRAPRAASSPLPRGQAMLVALLVDQPQATGAALRDHMLDHVTDPRLRPIAEAVLEGVRSGEMPTRADLLARVEPHVALELRDTIFGGRYENVDDPSEVLAESLKQMELGALDLKIHELDRAIVAAKAAGDHAGVLSATQAKLELRRRQSDIQTVGRPAANPSR